MSTRRVRYPPLFRDTIRVGGISATNGKVDRPKIRYGRRSGKTGRRAKWGISVKMAKLGGNCNADRAGKLERMENGKSSKRTKMAQYVQKWDQFPKLLGIIGNPPLLHGCWGIMSLNYYAIFSARGAGYYPHGTVCHIALYCKRGFSDTTTCRWAYWEIRRGN